MVTAKSNSRLQIGPWIKRALEWRERRRVERRCLFVDEVGRRAVLKYFDGEILEWIARVQSSFPDLILSSINVKKEYGLSRSFRRGSNSEALNRGVSEAAIDGNNR